MKIQLPARITALPSAMKMALLASGGIAGLMIVGSGLSLLGYILNFGPSEIVQPLPESLSVPAANSPEDASPSGFEASQKAVDMAYIGLEGQVADLDSQVRLGRAARWQQWAVVECNKNPTCGNPQEILSQRLSVGIRDLNDLLQQTTTSEDAEGRSVVVMREELSLHARSVAQYRAKRDELLDIAKALSLRPGTNVQINFISSAPLIDEMGEFEATAKQLGLAIAPATDPTSQQEEGE